GRAATQHRRLVLPRAAAAVRLLHTGRAEPRRHPPFLDPAAFQHAGAARPRGAAGGRPADRRRRRHGDGRTGDAACARHRARPVHADRLPPGGARSAAGAARRTAPGSAAMMRRWIPSPPLSLALFVIWLLLNQSLDPATLLLAAFLALVVPLLTKSLRPASVRMRRPGVAARLTALALHDMVASALHVSRRL